MTTEESRVPDDPAALLLPRPRRAGFAGWCGANEAVDIAVVAELPPEGYRLRIAEDGVRIDAADERGSAYARTTLAQLARIRPGMLPIGEVDDWPDLAVRGVLLDISRDKVPTTETLLALVDLLADLKFNHVELYSEHTFAYPGHEVVWKDASPLTADDIAVLDRRCRERHIELVPNQNCLGHLERWLQHPPYRRLALDPGGWVDPSGLERRPPGTLDPDHPDSMSFVRGLLRELLPHFSASRAHVGLDEPRELEKDRHARYLVHLRRLRAAPELDGREMLVWGDVLAEAPELAHHLPAGVTVCEWGYFADSPFEDRLRVPVDAGVPVWACPGTSSWHSFLGRAFEARPNIATAAAAATATGASGFLVTDWGDRGHHQPLVVSFPWYAWAASQAWCAAANRELSPAALDLNVFGGATGVGDALLELADASTTLPRVRGASSLALHFYFPAMVLGDGLTDGFDVAGFEAGAARVADGVAAVQRAARGGGVDPVVVEEIEQAAAVLLALADDACLRLRGDGSLSSVAAGERGRLAARMAELAQAHRRAWLRRNRPGGLDDSAAWFDRLVAAYAEPPPAVVIPASS